MQVLEAGMCYDFKAGWPFKKHSNTIELNEVQIISDPYVEFREQLVHVGSVIRHLYTDDPS